MRSRIFILATALSAMASGQDAGKINFSLEEAKTYAVENHLRVKNAKLDYEASKKKVQETTAIGLPQVTAEADYKYYLDIPVSVIDAQVFDPSAPAGETVAVRFGQTNNAFANLRASQLIFDGTFFVGLQAARTYKELREKGIDKTEIDVKDLVSRSYYNVLVGEEYQKIFTENVLKLESQFHEISEMQKAGFIEEVEVDQLNLILSDARARKSTIERQIKVSYQLLNFQMGRNLDAELILTDELATIYRSYDEGKLLNSQINVENHIDFKIIETQERIQELVIKGTRASRLPRLEASYSLMQNAYANPLNNPDWYASSYVGLHVTMPIFTSTMNSSKLQQNKIELSQLQNNKSILQDNLAIEVSVARTKYIDAQEQLKTDEKNLNLSKKIFDITTTKQKNGLASSLDVTTANNQYLETQGKYINSMYNLLDSKTKLDKALNNY